MSEPITQRLPGKVPAMWDKPLSVFSEESIGVAVLDPMDPPVDPFDAEVVDDADGPDDDFDDDEDEEDEDLDEEEDAEDD